ncbi:hypothetical protein EDC96DRAFT_607874 [Choanephora cucurbitarum]|nr:hypothetical protein EDC96DRAFT_607874 [Choanephora cucurbitarum]
MQTPKGHDWLPLPSGLQRRSHHSFTKELLSRFDRLYQPEVISIDQCSIHSITDSIPSEPKVKVASRRHRSAGDLLRKSSVYLKNRLYDDPWKKNKRKSRLDLCPKPSVIQYPPKPLVYSPIQPLPPDDPKPNTLHRLSMPLLKLTQYDTLYHTRSDPDLPIHKPKSIMHTVTKQWHKLVLKLKRA